MKRRKAKALIFFVLVLKSQEKSFASVARPASHFYCSNKSYFYGRASGSGLKRIKRDYGPKE